MATSNPIPAQYNTPQLQAYLSALSPAPSAGGGGSPNYYGPGAGVPGNYTPPATSIGGGYATTGQVIGQGDYNYGGSNYTPQMPKGGAVVGAGDIGTGTVNIPQPPKPVNYTGTILGNNTGLSPTGVLNPDGTIQIPQQTADGKASEGGSLADIIREMSGVYQKPESQADIYNTLEAASGLEAKKSAVRTYTNQINAITAQAQADQLSTIGQGRGVPEVIIGGQQAQISKEAAIKVLPIQAQLSAAQGDLEQAQSHVDKLFQIYSADSMAKTEYYNRVAEKSYDIFSKKEQQKLDDIRAEKKAQADALQRDIDYQRDLSKQAIGQGAVFTQISSLRPPVLGSKTYAQDLAKYQKDLAVAGGKIRNVGDEIAMANLNISRANLAINQAKLKMDLDASKPIDVASIVSNPNLPASEKNTAVITSLLKNPKISGTTRTQSANALAVVNSLQTLADGRPTGKFEGLGPVALAGRIPFYNTQDATTNVQNIEAINLKVQQWASGASLTDQQTKQVNRLTPSIRDTDLQIRQKMNGLVDFMNTNVQSQFQSEGIDFKPMKVDLFENMRSINALSKAQLSELNALRQQNGLDPIK